MRFRSGLTLFFLPGWTLVWMTPETLVFGGGEFFHWGDCLHWSFEVSQTPKVSDSWDLVQVEERPRHWQANAAGAGYP